MLGAKHGSNPENKIRLTPIFFMLEFSRPESGAQMSWIAAVRLGWPAEYFILNAAASLRNGGMFPNLLGSDGGGGLETTGITLAINEMLLQSHEQALRFFPVWPQGWPASFTTLRTVGGFLVSASVSAAAGNTSPDETATGARGAKAGRQVAATIHSTVGGECFVFTEMRTLPSVTTLDGHRVQVLPASTGRVSFNTTTGATYALSMQL